MKIGGEKEKVLGAKREKIYNLIFPKQNQDAVMALDEEIKEGCNFYFVEHFDEVFNLVFD